LETGSLRVATAPRQPGPLQVPAAGIELLSHSLYESQKCTCPGETLYQLFYSFLALFLA